ncbi:hypothetical protein KOY_02675 [Bacillus cereus VDM021]|nr:hypothetical protein IIW_01575 [Bacillus cereus VD136]EOQ08462.1 hypothetical protein KOY_02675 [Bacillus cereus VDM021]
MLLFLYYKYLWLKGEFLLFTIVIGFDYLVSFDC